MFAMGVMILMMSVNLNKITVLNVQSIDYRYNINVIGKSEAVILL